MTKLAQINEHRLVLKYIGTHLPTCLLQCSKGKLKLRRACCIAASMNSFSGKLAAMQQGQTGTQASLLQCSKHEFIFRGACCIAARANQV